MQKILKATGYFFHGTKTIIFLKQVSPAGGSSLLAHWWVIRPKEIRKKKAQTPAQNKKVNIFSTKKVKAGAEECKKAVILSAFSKPLWKSRNRRDRKKCKKRFLSKNETLGGMCLEII